MHALKAEEPLTANTRYVRKASLILLITTYEPGKEKASKLLTIKAAERQNAAPLELESSYSSYSASKRRRSAAAMARSRGSCKSRGVPPIVQAPL